MPVKCSVAFNPGLRKGKRDRGWCEGLVFLGVGGVEGLRVGKEISFRVAGGGRCGRLHGEVMLHEATEEMPGVPRVVPALQPILPTTEGVFEGTLPERVGAAVVASLAGAEPGGGREPGESGGLAGEAAWVLAGMAAETPWVCGTQPGSAEEAKPGKEVLDCKTKGIG
jgi:hypothetical protein